ncbi:phage tail protein [Yersinia mollaretii]|uniref:phage tail-collar fiber domain-containing protein n=1 Tax=Yersinia mollaretii TaxID=33060 RepID=UPI0036F1E20F
MPTPHPSQTQLLNERHRAAINSLTLDPIQTNRIGLNQCAMKRNYHKLSWLNGRVFHAPP